MPLLTPDMKLQQLEKEWKCTNTLASLNLRTMCWEDLSLELLECKFLLVNDASVI